MTARSKTAKLKKLPLQLALSVAMRIILLTTPVLAIYLCAMLFNSNATRNIVFNGDFEDGNLTRWGKGFIRGLEGENFTKSGREVCCKHSAQIVNSPTKEGNYAAKFTLYKDDPDASNSRRAELRLNAVPTKSEYWYGFSIYLPLEFVKDTSFEIVTQWNAKPDRDLGEDWRSPQMSLTTQNGQWKVHRLWDPKPVTRNNTPAGKESIDLGKYQTAVWTDWVFHVKWSYKSDGLVEVWKNGKLVIRKTGPNTYNDRIGPYQKFGIYKPEWKYNRDESITTKRVVYFDSVRMGNASSNYEDVAP